MTDPINQRRLRHLGARMNRKTARPADGRLFEDGREYAPAQDEAVARLHEAGVEMIVETWTKTDLRHVPPPEPAETAPELDALDDQILATIGVDPRPAADLAATLGITDGVARGRLQALRDAGLVETAGNRGWRLA